MKEEAFSDRLVLEANHLKDIILHSRKNKGVDVIIRVQPSRFKKILGDIRSLHGLYVEGLIEEICSKYDYFSFYSNDIGDKNGNKYTVLKTKALKEKFGKCEGCDCNYKRFINSKTGVCFFKEDMANDYVTKIPD